MMLQYGDFFLNLLCVRKYEKQAVFDGPNYAYSRVTIVVDAIFNPATQSDSWAASPRYTGGILPVPPNPVATLGDVYAVVGDPTPTFPGGPRGPSNVPAVVSEVAIRHYLMQPRLILQMSVGGVVTLRSPIQGFATDAMGGPTPLFVNVAEIYGTRTWLVQYGISCCINDCPYYEYYYPLLLSHTFEMSDTLDQDYFATRVTRGRAVFRADGMLAEGQIPDNFRALLVPPIPLGFKRERVHVVQDQQPNILQFETIDRELPIGWQQAGVTRVRAFHTYGFHKGNAEQAAVRQAYALFSQALKETGTLLSRTREMVGPGGVEVASVEAVMGGIALNAIGAGVGASLNYLTETQPITEHVIDVEVWGDATSSRRGLEAFARAVIRARLSRLVSAMAGVTRDGVNVLSLALANLPVGFGGPMAAALQTLLSLQAAANATGAFALGVASQVLPLSNVLSSRLISLLAPGVDTIITHDIAGKSVHIRHVVHVGPIASALSGLSAGQDGVDVVSSDLVFPENDNTEGLLVMGGTPLGPSFDGVSRSTSFATPLNGTPYRYACEPPPLWWAQKAAEGSEEAQLVATQGQQIEQEGMAGLDTSLRWIQVPGYPDSSETLPGDPQHPQLQSPPVVAPPQDGPTQLVDLLPPDVTPADLGL